MRPLLLIAACGLSSTFALSTVALSTLAVSAVAGSARAAAPLADDDPDARKNRAIAAVVKGQALAQQGRKDEALAAFRDALAAYPAYPLAHHELALVLAESGDLAGAEANLRQALTLAPDFARAEQALAEVLRREKRHAEALPHFAAALRANEKDAAAWYGLAASLRATQKPAEALWATERLLDALTGPDGARVSPLAAEAEKAAEVARADGIAPRPWDGLTKTAVAAAEPKAGLGPDGLPIHAGDADFRRQAYVAALEAYKAQASTKDGEKDAILAYKIGATWAVMNETRQAIAWWKKALALDPGRELVGRHLVLLVAKQRQSDLATATPATPGDIVARARTALIIGDPATALWLVRGSTAPEAAALEGEARLQLGDFSGARAIFEEILSEDAEDRVAKGGLAEALLRGPQTSSTTSLAEKALAAWLGDDEARLDTFLVLRRGEVQARLLMPETEE